MNEKNKNKAQLSDVIWTRITSLIRERGLSQTDLQRLCIMQGYQISQPEISKLFSGAQHLNLYQFIAFSDVLGIPADYLIDEDAGLRRIQVGEASFVIDSTEDAFAGYLGTYHTVFMSTSPFETKVLHGEISFAPMKNARICGAVFKLNTGERDENGKCIYKFYQGQLIISRKLNVAYCILVNEKIGEISVIEFRHRNFLVKQAECRLGLVLTVTAGERKEPVTHRIFLSRSSLDDQNLEKILPYLKQETDEALISQKDLQMLAEKRELSFDFSLLMRNEEGEVYYRVDDKSIRKVDSRLSRLETAEILSLIKSLSYGRFDMPLSEEDDGSVFSMIQPRSG